MWKDVLWQLQKLLSPEEALEALDSNTECFHKAGAIVKILLTSKVNCMLLYSRGGLRGLILHIFHGQQHPQKFHSQIIRTRFRAHMYVLPKVHVACLQSVSKQSMGIHVHVPALHVHVHVYVRVCTYTHA